ncbi:MAG: WYL domain-containing protein [Gemmatimonadetes bacterium]|nr:WYL domain-containing protein [Gemmatimonadota bacterium]
MPPDNTASAQLERILYILPAAAREDGVGLEELASALGIDAATVLRDIEHVTAREYYHPAGAVNKFSIMIDRSSVRVHAPQEFRRPVRLNAREALALGLGLRCLAADAEPERRREILQLAARLEAELCAPGVETVHEMRSARFDALRSMSRVPDADVLRVDDRAVGDYMGLEDDVELEDDGEFEDYALAFDDDGFRSVVADAIELGRLCTIWYLKPGDVAPAYRSIAPYRLVYAEGRWYVAAFDLDREALRFFRMDRVLNAALEEDAAPDLPPVELSAFLVNGGPYMAGDDVEVSVRYSPVVARWVMERTAASAHDDGSVMVRHRVADPRWIVRHVLQYGGEAVVDEPAEARDWVAAAAADVKG